MPDFKFRNLTVKVGDQLELCAPDSRIQALTPLLCRRFYSYCLNYSRPCDWGTRFPTITITITNCRFGSIPIPTCGISEEPTTWGPEVDVDLEVLKKQLTEQLEAVEAEQVREAAAAKPATVEEADALKAELQAAMDELDAHRAELAKGEDA